MRDIKFRAWIKKEYDQCGGFMLYDPDEEATDYFMVCNGTGFAVVFDEDWLKDDAYEIMQFTGLHDKNGKEIYEGDVLRCIGENYIGTVSFKSGCFVTDCEGWGEVCMSGSNLEDIEVIGNIHQNPELLEELA